jgi:hypothetical protein
LPSTVTNLLDGGAGSLRQAILDTPAGGTVDFQPGLSGTITLTTGQLLVNKDLTIAGPGAGVITVSGNHASPRVFEIAATFTVDLSGLTIADGYSSVQGGGVLNNGTLTVGDTVFRNNWVIASLFASGGAIYNAGTLAVSGSTFSGNLASGTHMGSSGRGGAIYNAGTLAVSGSTFSGNLTTDDSGGGIYNGDTLNISSSTFSGNSARLGGGIFISVNSRAHAQNTILAGNTAAQGPDLFGSLTSSGYNLIGNTLGGFGFDPTDLLNVDPLLGPLQDNGGPTFTMALLPGSPAIDAGDPTGAPEWDQRGPGYPRVVNGKIDIGAYEHQAVAPTITCSVADSLLWPPNHRLVNVGLSVDVQPPDATVQVQVYANDNANASDAADIAPGTLELRAARQGHGNGRVYLIAVTATSGGQTAFDVCTVVVPHDQSAGSIARVQAAAAAAEAYYRELQAAPAGYALLGEGPTDAGDSQSSTPTTTPTTLPLANTFSGSVIAPVDGYFALRSEEQGGGEAGPWVPDRWLNEGRLFA